MYDVVTITVNYKMKEDIIRMLNHLKSDIKESALKVLPVVVDNDSRDGLGAYIRENLKDVEFIDAGANLGFGRANNLALRRFDAKYYFILNPDVIFTDEKEKIIERMYKWMENHPAVGMIGPKLLNFDGSLQFSCHRFADPLTQPLGRLGLHERWNEIFEKYKKFQMSDFNHNSTRPVDWIMGSAMFIRGAAYKEVGGFDDRFFMYFEDCDLCRRFWESGWPVYYVHDISILHGHRRASAAKSAHLFDAIVSIFKNKLTRIHLLSWIKYFLKWRGRHLP